MMRTAVCRTYKKNVEIIRLKTLKVSIRKEQNRMTDVRFKDRGRRRTTRWYQIFSGQEVNENLCVFISVFIVCPDFSFLSFFLNLEQTVPKRRRRFESTCGHSPQFIFHIWPCA